MVSVKRTEAGGKLMCFPERLLCLPGKTDDKRGVRDDPRLPAESDRMTDLFRRNPLADSLEHFTISAFDTETDTVATGLLHQPERFQIDRIDAGKGAPGKSQTTAKDLFADLLHLPAARNEQVVRDVDPVDPVCEDFLDLVHHPVSVSQADAVSDHPPSKTKYAGIGAASGGDDADRVAEGLVAGKRQKMAGGQRQVIEILDQGTGTAVDDLFPPAEE